MINIDEGKVYRIVIAQDTILKVNMVYTEIGEDNYQVLGSFSGEDGSVGFFHQSSDAHVSVSGDYFDFEFEFEENFNLDEISNIDGNLVGLSKEGHRFLETVYNDDGYVEAYSKGASEDFIYDVQNEWNLNFRIS